MYATNGELTASSGIGVPVCVVDDASSTWGSEGVPHQVIGRRGVLPATGVRRTRTGTLRVACPTQASWRALRTVLDTGDLLTFTTSCAGLSPAVLMVTEVRDSLLVPGGTVRMVDLVYSTVSEDPPALPADWTWQAVKDGYLTWTAVGTAYGSWAGVLGARTGAGVGW